MRTHRTQTHLLGLQPCQYLVYLTIILRSISDGDPCGRMSPEVTPGPGKTKLEMGLVFLYILTLEAIDARTVVRVYLILFVITEQVFTN